MSQPRPRPGGCLTLAAFALLELATAIVTGAVAFLLFDAVLVPIIPASERDFAHVLAATLALVAAAVPVWYVDRWCRRRTGTSIVDSIPHIP